MGRNRWSSLGESDRRLAEVEARLAELAVEHERWRLSAEAEIARLREVCSVWELTLRGMEGRALGGLRGVERSAGVELRGYDDPNQLKEQPEDYEAEG